MLQNRGTKSHRQEDGREQEAGSQARMDGFWITTGPGGQRESLGAQQKSPGAQQEDPGRTKQESQKHNRRA